MQYWTIVNNVKVGPMNAAQLIAYGINPNSLVWCEGMAQWTQACRVPELMPYFRSAQPVNNFRPCPSTYFPWAIVTTLLCCFPAGIIALIYSTMVESRYSRRLLRLGESVGNRSAVVYNSLGVRPCKLALRTVL